MLQKSHSLTATWLCLFLYSGLFTLLQEVLFPPITINLDRKAGQPVRLSLHLEPKLQ